jgi:hypothetical protein
MKPARDVPPRRHALLAVASGLVFLHGLANCGSNLGGGGVGGHGGTGGSCWNGGVPPGCFANDVAGASGFETGGRGGSSSPGDGGTGGGGSGGGGAGGSVATTWAPPSCLGDLFAACPMDGECHYAAGVGLEYCFASGTSVDYVTSHTCGASDVTSDKYTVNKSDGSLCYTFEAVWHPSCEFVAQWSWKNAAGEVVATGSGDWGQGTHAGVQCAAGGASVTCSGGSCPFSGLTGALGPFGPTTCSAGTCP